MPRTLFGRYAYAIGSSAKAAQRAGVPVARWRIAYYVTCGVLSALAGLVFVARTGQRPAERRRSASSSTSSPP